MSEQSPCIVGVQSCGCITYVNSRPDALDREDQKAIGQIIASGGSVLRTTVEDARKMPHFLVAECPHDPKGWEPEPYVDPATVVRLKRSYGGWYTVYRGYGRIGSIVREDRRERRPKGAWLATRGWFNPDNSASDGSERMDPVEVLGPFAKRQDALDALVSPVASSEPAGAAA